MLHLLISSLILDKAKETFIGLQTLTARMLQDEGLFEFSAVVVGWRGGSTSCIKVQDQTVQKHLPGLNVRNHPATQCHIPEEKNPWQYRCKETSNHAKTCHIKNKDKQTFRTKDEQTFPTKHRRSIKKKECHDLPLPAINVLR